MISQNDPAGLVHAKKLIKESLKTKATFLDLGNCGLRDLRELPELWDCHHLERLNLGPEIVESLNLQTNNLGIYNNISKESIKILGKRLGFLKSLDFTENEIGNDGAKVIGDLFFNLESLELQGCNITGAGIKSICERSKKIKNLSISNNRIGVNGLRSISQNLLKLESLNIGENYLGDKAIIEVVDSLQVFKEFTISNNNLSKLAMNYIASYYPHLEILDLSFNKIGDDGVVSISNSILGLKELSLHGCNFGDIGAFEIANNLKLLHKLHLADNLISDNGAKKIVNNLKLLRSLNIAYNKINKLKYFIGFLNRNKNLPILSDGSFETSGLNISENNITDVPSKIVHQGREAILEYFKQKEISGSKQLLEAKMVLLGDGRAGKTSLACRLLGKELPKEEDRTKGVDIMIGDYTFPVEEGEFTLNIWDFAGQDKYKPLHQFFYSESTLYVMVADSGNANTDFSDWFETAKLYGEGSPLIVVLNEFSDGMGYGIFTEEQWKTKFPSLIKVVHIVNLLKQKDISILERDIRHFARQLPHVQYEFPTNWANIRAELERRRDENSISFQEYLRICRENNLPERNSALILSSVLHKIGVCLHYQKSELLSQHIIFKNEWATTAVYKILEDHTIAEVKKGFFDMEDLHRIWSDTEYQDMIPQLLELMREFKLAYPLPVLNEFVAPPLLPQAQPRDIEIPENNAIQVMLEFEFLPKALMTQFIVSHHKDIDNNRTMVWRDGVVLRWPSNTRAIIRKIKSRGRDAFQILVTGTEQRGLLTSIIKTLRDLSNEYKGIRVQEIVKCPCEGCQSGKNEQHYFELSNLTFRLENNRRDAECDKSLLKVDIMEMLGDMFTFKTLRPGEKIELIDEESRNKDVKTIKIFLASSSELVEDRNEFDLYFRQKTDNLLKEKGIYLNIVRWENFLDAMSETRLQDEYNEAILACDIFVSLFFTKTGRYTEEEFDVAHRKFNDTSGLKPQIFTFFRNADIKTGSITDEINTLLAFKEKLKTLGHYHTQYDNIDQLKLKFRDQLERLIRKGKI